jgi:hypothetical protein
VRRIAKADGKLEARLFWKIVPSPISPWQSSYGPVGLRFHGHLSIPNMRLPHPGVGSGQEDEVTEQEKLARFDAYEAYLEAIKLTGQDAW